ncbi:LysM peptidoglycan-binding domain-containing protein [Sphingosinicella rhizophila]|uniref:LysM peptidoglycan-binding domain-containing protein n=1 Tax=Sphingosinicella rhizophila TaxID=3050082 RepID=A0ABU3Q628_9SPHN|nr:LysM peptidoglycan-binding domain-containing protein [Sphingosinicella sp. GR2756]MDT9598859.1 LysM peptidoglycan-binding domain-containing protein [Sphingosinicella sp. GR2756]
MTVFASGRSRRRGFIMATVLATVLLGGCGGKTNTGAVESASGSAATGWKGRSQVMEAIELLNRGEPVPARKLLMAVLKKQPGDSVARQLIDQIDRDPKILLGTENHRYTLKEGDSLSVLAARHLGNPMMFFALARYNDIAVPSSVGPGQTILLPGRAPTPAVVRKPAPKPGAAPSQKTGPAQGAAKAPSPASKPAQRPANAAQASKLRGQGLAAMNSGSINRAVTLLRQALSLDPSSAVIRNDLNRALRIQGTVRARP